MAEDPDVSDLRYTLAEKLADALVAPIPTATPRRLFGATALAGKVTAVIGMRRSGKTTYLHQRRREARERGVSQERLPYINFEDERLVGLDASRLHVLVEEYYRRFPALRRQETVYWYFDEPQVVTGWERFVRRLLDTERVELCVSGSSAALPSREIATATASRGRAWAVVIAPFAFDEALCHQGITPPTDVGALDPAARSRLEKSFGDYLTVGGFPQAQALGALERRQLLSDLVDVVLLRDVIERHNVSQAVGLRWLVRQLLANAGSLFSVEKFHAALRSQGLAMGKDTLHHLLALLEDCFLVRTVWVESSSERQRMVNPRKAYPADPGLIPVFDRSRKTNIGHALETAVLHELCRRKCDVTYVRLPSGREVDFLARSPTGQTELIQVCADASSDAAKRELQALAEAAERFPEAISRLLTLTRDGLPRAVPNGVRAEPAYEWMLTAPAE